MRMSHRGILLTVTFLIGSGLCGVDERIVRGQEVDIGSYPYMASMQVSETHKCGATIVSSRWLLIAAHCAFKPTDPEYTIRFPLESMTMVTGQTDIYASVPSGQRYGVTVFTVHESYPAVKGYDIGMIMVERPILFGPSTKVVNLVKRKDPARDRKALGACVTLGWGSTEPRFMNKVFEKMSSPMNILKIADLSLVTMDFCMSKLKNIIPHRQICAMSNEQKDACWGDSGGPLVCNGEQWGTTSWGRGCARKNFPAVWTRDDYFLDWISKAMLYVPAVKSSTNQTARLVYTNVHFNVLLFIALNVFNLITFIKNQE